MKSMMKHRMKIHIQLCTVSLAAFFLAACTENETPEDSHGQSSPEKTIEAAPAQVASIIGSERVFVHLFEWRWPDIAAECENFLGPSGYSAVQISPPQEHIKGPQWWTRYQPVSYKLESRGGTRAEFIVMVQRCKMAGVDIYADAIINHMADVATGTGIAGSEYSEYQYPVPYDFDDFHHCGRNGNDSIADYQDLWEVQNCNLGALPDINTGKPAVQKKIAAYLNDLLSLGVAGLRMDAVKHIDHNEVNTILSLMDSKPFVFQEVIDRGDEPINAMDYLANGSVTEFKYSIEVVNAFVNGRLDGLRDLGSQAGYLPAEKAVVFTDNHDTQRGHQGDDGVLNYKDGSLYDLANVFMLAWPYGYPKVMSSYRFDDHSQGPPDSMPVKDGACTSDWVCEHRRSSRVGMIGFRKAVADAPVTNWQAFGDELISFGRGDRGHVVINISAEPVDGTFVTQMKPGSYPNVVTCGVTEDICNDSTVKIGDDGVMQISLAPLSAVAIHNGPSP